MEDDAYCDHEDRSEHRPGEAAMNTIEQPQAPGHGSRRSEGDERGTRADTADIVLLLVTILTLMGAAAGIAIGFPLALETVAAHANATTAVYPAPQARLAHQHQEYSTQPEEEIEEYDEPLIVDDVRSEERMYAAAQVTALFDGSTPQPSTTHD
jgi:hypothetical protein